MISYSIYVVDDEAMIRDGITVALESEYHVESFSTAEGALAAIERNQPDLVLLDIGLPGINGIDALRRIKVVHPDVLVIMITAYEDVSTVISAMKSGAYDYVVKPIHMEGLEVTIRNALKAISLKKEVHSLQERYLRENVPCFIAESNAIQDVMEFIEAVAKSPDTPILIFGETGTGKELIASAIHYRSPNFEGPLVTVNCAAIPRELIESELFGYEKGAFSGAGASGKRGLLETASRGTLFLDEVGDLSLEAQAKLLRFLEKGEFYRVGGTQKIAIQTRVVSATNKDLDDMINGGLFRRDLYFRLGVVKVQVPSLNERRDDIVPLAKYFVLEFSRKFAKTFTGLCPEAERALMAHHWTGNVRELRNIIERAALVGRGPEVRLEDLGIGGGAVTAPLKQPTNEFGFPQLCDPGIDLTSTLESLERHYVTQALKLAGGNESRAAKLLKLNHHTFRYRRKKLQIE